MFEKKAQEMMEKAQYIQALGSIYTYLEDKMQWDCMKYNEPDETHSKAWFTEYDDDEMPDDVRYQYKAYKSVLDAIEKLAK